jgi:biopolymer transport protein ExbD
MKRIRRRLLDLTPLLDVIMILLFGTMINSVELARLAQGKSEDPARSSEPPTPTPASVEEERAALLEEKSTATRRWQIERATLLRTLGRLAGLSEKDLASIDAKLSSLASAPADQVDSQINSLKESMEGEELARAIARLREMQKVFSFVDLHVEGGNFLSVKSDGEQIERFSILDRSSSEIEAELRRTVEPLRFSEVVLILFSYDGTARDRVVESAESAVNSLLDRLRADQSQRGRQFRVGRVGMIRGPASAKEND